MTKNGKRKRSSAGDAPPAKLCVVIDLDHTLLHTRPATDCRASDDDVEERTFSFSLASGRYKTTLRPYAIDFWKAVAASEKTATFGVWTAGASDYAEAIVEEICKRADIARKPDFVLSRDACCMFGRHVVKDLRELVVLCDQGERIVLVDDNKANLTYNGGGVLTVPPYTTDGSWPAPTSVTREESACYLKRLIDAPLMLELAAAQMLH